MSTRPGWKLPVQRPGQRRPDAGRGNSGQRGVPHSWLAGEGRAGWRPEEGGLLKEGWFLGVPQWRQLVSFAVENPHSEPDVPRRVYFAALLFFGDWSRPPIQWKVACDGSDRTAPAPPAIFWWSVLPQSSRCVPPAEPATQATAIVQAHGCDGVSPDELPRVRLLLT